VTVGETQERVTRFGELPMTAVQEALYADQVFRRLFRAPAVPRWRPTAKELTLLQDPQAGARLRPSQAVAFVRERFPLLHLRHHLKASEDEAVTGLPLPAPHERGPRDWALLRLPTGWRVLALAPLQARLYRDLAAQPFSVALASLESACPQEQLPQLSSRLRGYVAEGMAHDLWCGIAIDLSGRAASDGR